VRFPLAILFAMVATFFTTLLIGSQIDSVWLAIVLSILVGIVYGTAAGIWAVLTS
jgi:hypothetical protein